MRMHVLAGLAALSACKGSPTPTAIGSHVAAPRVDDPLRAAGVRVPPREHEPWTPGAALPADLAAAIAKVFEHGLADPRGLEYREVELVVAAAEGDEVRAKTHAWVFDGDRHAVAWNGLAYPVARVGEIRDARADAARLRTATPPREPVWAEAEAVAVERITLLKIALLARIGEDAIATALWKAQPIEGDAYLAIARAWTYALFDRAATARVRGERALALISARAAGVAAAAVRREAVRRRLPEPHLEGLDELPRLVDDLQRVRPARPAMPDDAALAAMPEPQRLRLLIERLDEIRMAYWHHAWGDRVFLPAFTKIGTAAIDALVPVIETDPRLTLTVTPNSNYRHLDLHGVEDAAGAAVHAILNRSFGGFGYSIGDAKARAALAAEIRAYWDTWRNVTLEEKWYRQLADDRADHHEQVMAALELTQPAKQAQHKLRGDPLRTHAPPTVSSLLEKRMATAEMHDACYFAAAYHRWEPATANAAIARLQARAITESGTTGRHGPCISELAKLLLAGGDPGGLDAHAQWIASLVPTEEWMSSLMYAALALQPSRPAVVRALDAMFRDGSPWLPLADPTGKHRDLSEFLHENLLDHPAVNRQTLAALADKRSFGTLDIPEPTRYRVKPHHHGGGLESLVDTADPHAPPLGTKQTVRVADWTAYRIVNYRDRLPAFALYWSEPRRDAAIAAIAAWVRAQRRP